MKKDIEKQELTTTLVDLLLILQDMACSVEEALVKLHLPKDSKSEEKSKDGKRRRHISDITGS